MLNNLPLAQLSTESKDIVKVLRQLCKCCKDTPSPWGEMGQANARKEGKHYISSGVLNARSYLLSFLFSLFFKLYSAPSSVSSTIMIGSALPASAIVAVACVAVVVVESTDTVTDTADANPESSNNGTCQHIITCARGCCTRMMPVCYPHRVSLSTSGRCRVRFRNMLS